MAEKYQHGLNGGDKNMEPYNQYKRYLGPQGHWLTKLIPEVPPGCEEIQPYWNRAAYNHDCGYEGKKESGFWGRLKNFFKRRKIDVQFYEELLLGVEAVKERLTFDQYQNAKAYANIIYTAVRSGGWKFYRVS